MRVPNYPGILRFVAVLLLLGGLAWFARSYASSHFSPSRLRVLVASFGPLAPVVYVALYALLPLLLFPASLLTACAGLLWNWKWALLYALLGSNFCANLGFGLARALGQERVQKLTRGRVRRYEKKLEGAGVGVIALLRAVPAMPFSFLSYTAGVSRIRWRDYALGHFLGTLPGTTFFIVVLEAVIQ